MPRTALTIGNFDGVHVGHRALIERARELAGPGGRVVVLSFDPHPFTRLRPEAVPGRLTTFERRAALLREAGADEVVRLEPTAEQLAMSPGEFAAWFVEAYAPAHVIEGPDFHFGRGRAGTVETLRALGAGMPGSRRFEVHVLPAVEVGLGDQLLAPASSSLVRWLLGHGRVGDARIVLGRAYELAGEVVRGDRRGRTLGFPTANIDAACLLPGDGVYAGRAVLADGRAFAAAVNIGTRPTFSGVSRRLEAHLVGVPTDGDRIANLPEYGWPITLHMLAFIRDDVRFDSAEALRGQIGRDVARAEEWASSAAPGAGHAGGIAVNA